MCTQDYLRLALSSKCVQAFLRFRMGSLGLLCANGRAAKSPKAQRVCTLCRTGNLVNEQHPGFECPALQLLETDTLAYSYLRIMSLQYLIYVATRHFCNLPKNVRTHTEILAL